MIETGHRRLPIGTISGVSVNYRYRFRLVGRRTGIGATSRSASTTRRRTAYHPKPTPGGTIKNYAQLAGRSRRHSPRGRNRPRA